MTVEGSNLRRLPSLMRRSFTKRRSSLDAPHNPPPSNPPKPTSPPPISLHSTSPSSPSSNWLHSTSPACSLSPSSTPWHAHDTLRPSTKVARSQNLSLHSSSLSSSCPHAMHKVTRSQNMSVHSSSLSSSCPPPMHSSSPPSSPEGGGRDGLRQARANVRECEAEIERLHSVVEGMERQAKEARAAEKLRGARAEREGERQAEIVRLRAVVDALERQISGVSAAEDGRTAWLAIVEDELRLARAEVRKGLVGIGEREDEVERLEAVVEEMGNEIDHYRAAARETMGEEAMRDRMDEMEEELRVAKDEVRERDDMVREREDEVDRLERFSIGIGREIEEIKRAWAREGTGWFEDAEDGIEWKVQCDRDLENEKARRAMEKALDESRAAAAKAEKSLAATKKSLGHTRAVAAKAEVSLGEARAVVAKVNESLAEAVAAKRTAEEAASEEKGRREVLERAVAECGARARQAEAAATGAMAEVARLQSSTPAARGGLAARDAEVVKNVEEKLLARAEARAASSDVFEIRKETGALREALRARDKREEGQDEGQNDDQNEGAGTVGTLTWVIVAGVVGGIVGHPTTAQRAFC